VILCVCVFVCVGECNFLVINIFWFCYYYYYIIILLIISLNVNNCFNLNNNNNMHDVGGCTCVYTQNNNKLLFN